MMKLAIVLFFLFGGVAVAAPPVGPVPYTAFPDCQKTSPANHLNYTGSTGAFACGVGDPIFNVANFGALCDGTTNDATAIQAVVTAAANVGIVYIPPKATACMLGATVTLPSNTHITVDGILKLQNAVNDSVLTMAVGASNVTLDGHGILDGNRANQSADMSAGFFSTSGSNLTIRDVRVQHTRNSPIHVVGMNKCLVENVTSSDSGNSFSFAGATTNCWAISNHIDTNDDISLAFYGGTNFSGAIGNTVTNGGADGIGVLNDTAQPNPSHDLVISGNTVTGSQIAGVGVVRAAGGNAPHFNISITGNVLTSNGQGNNGFGGVRVVGSTSVSIVGNMISNDGNGSGGASGVNISGTTAEILVTGNSIKNEGQGGTNGTGIVVGSSCTRCTYTDNAISDSQASKTMAFGFNGTLGTLNVVADNTVSATIGARYNLTFTSNSVFRANADVTIQRVTATNGGTTTVLGQQTGYILVSAGISTYTVQLPAVPYYEQPITIACTGAITTLTITPLAGSINAAPGTCAANSSMTWRWSSAANTWEVF